MSQILDEVNASGGNVAFIRSFEITCPAWSSAELVCTGFKDQVLGTEDGRTLTFTAMNLGVALADKNATGNQTLAVAVGNATGRVTELVDLAEAANARVSVVFRTHLSNNKSSPAEKPYRLVVLAGELEGLVASLQCGYYNILMTAYPRRYLTAEYAPGLRYI